MKHHIVTSDTKVYIRHKENSPANMMMASAYEGFSNLGAETTSFQKVEEIDEFEDLSPDTMIVGYIGDVWRGLRKLGKALPDPMDYPDSLKEFLHRDILKTTLRDVRNSDKPMFIKPVDHKLFTGFVWEGRKDDLSRRRIVHIDDTVEVFTCEPLNMLSEYRAMILEGEILDVRRYKGIWSLAPDAEVVRAAVKAFENSGEAPAAYTLDFAVTSIESSSESFFKTVLVEANDGFAFCNYGLEPEAYASCLAARWKEMTK